MLSWWGTLPGNVCFTHPVPISFSLSRGVLLYQKSLRWEGGEAEVARADHEVWRGRVRRLTLVYSFSFLFDSKMLRLVSYREEWKKNRGLCLFNGNPFTPFFITSLGFCLFLSFRPGCGWQFGKFCRSVQGWLFL